MEALTVVGKGKCIIAGDRADIFEYGKNSLLKLFRKEISSRHVEREVSNTKMAMAYGVPVPAIRDVTWEGGRQGIVMEHIKGPTITDILRKSPHKIKHYAQLLAQIQADLHQAPVTGFKSQREHMERAIENTKGRLGQETVQTILDMFKGLPDGDRICHNDLHQENIIFSEKGPVILDWQEALRGSPLADVIHALLIQQHPVPAPIFKSSSYYFQLHNQYRKLFAKFYLQEYIKITQATRDEIHAWTLPVAATRLFTKTAVEEKDWTEHFIRRVWQQAGYFVK